MSMEIQQLEFSVEDILNMHQSWIRKLFIEDNRSEVEIVQELHKRGLTVSVSQIHHCLLDWGLLQPQSSSINSASSHTAHTDPDDWEIIDHPSSSNTSTTSMTMNYSSTPPDPEICDIYKKKPLPSLPDQSKKAPSLSEHPYQAPYSEDQVPKNKRKNNDQQRSSPDKLKLTCPDGHKGFYEFESSLSTFPEVSSLLEHWASDEQSHEMVAVGVAVGIRAFRARQERGHRFPAAANGSGRARQAHKPRRRKHEGGEEKRRRR